jgi:hypothetical protein
MWVRAGWLTLAPLLLLARVGAVYAQTELDAFEDLSGWSVTASNGARIEIARDSGHSGMGMRLDFDLSSGGYVIVRKALAVTLPSNYAFKFYLRGDALPNNLEFKLVDRTGQNVWWYNQLNFDFPTEWREITIKKPRIRFAWGPAAGAALKQVAFIEFALAAGTGGKGSVWLDDLRLVERAASVQSESTPQVSASTALPGHEPEMILDPDPTTSWRSGTLAADQWIRLDFQKTREYGGLVIDWDPEDYATAYRVEASDDGENWSVVYSCAAGNGGRDYVYTPDAESRYVRLSLLNSSRGQGYGIRNLAVKPFAFSASPNSFFESIAADAPPGAYPKYFSGKQTYWTVIGVNGGHTKAVINEEGMLEVGRGGFSIEPFLFTNGALMTWHEVQTSQVLAEGYLPIPSVIWRGEDLIFTVTAFASGTADASTLYARYRVENVGAQHRGVELFLALRPFQVVPPWQSLNMVGGVTPIRQLTFDAHTVSVNGAAEVVSLTPPDRFGAATFEEGPVVDFLLEGKVPLATQVADPMGFASGALQYGLQIPPGGHQDVYLAVPSHGVEPAPASAGGEDAATRFTRALEATTRTWEALLGRVDFELPPIARPVARVVKSALAHILLGRDGPAIQPGPRNYARAWIRDGSLMSTALLEMGFTEEVREFIRWYAQYQSPDGRVPCCVDRRGPDPVPENDSNGELVYTIADYYRYTRDVGFLSEMWPAVVRAVDSIDVLRQQRMTSAFRQPGKQAYFGLLPQSISHEGYAAHPVHSYWDDFFALRGLKDAATLAAVVGDDDRAARFAALRDAFRDDLYASIARTMAQHKIDYIPGSVELGDFDATSTAIAVSPVDELANLPQPALTRTFDMYYDVVQQRLGARPDWDAFTPYELRNVGVLVRLGQRQRAAAVLDALLAARRPIAWNQWQEVVWRDADAPKFIGDMPHGWVASGFIRSVRSMLVYDRESDQALVLAAGVPAEWVMGESGVTVKRLPTRYGVLNYTLRNETPSRVRMVVSGDLSIPPGGLVLQPPLPRALTAVIVNGEPVSTFDAESATIRAFPADVVLEGGGPGDG